jgi:HAD superfamily hydrolase (TIGR01509 family)
VERAVIFDFDGLILDTETPLYEAWRCTFEQFNVEPISIEEWAVSLGRHDDDPLMIDPFARLQDRLGHSIAEDDVQSIRRRHRDGLLTELAVRPGVVALLDEASELGIAVGIASSSPRDWIEERLGPHGLLDRFSVLSCAGEELPGKPDPAVYLAACRALNSDPKHSLAFEDSPNGVSAAKAAGMTCIAVPTDLGRKLNFDHADRVVASLTDVSLHDLFRP